MEYRRLGRAGVRVSALGLGTNSFGTWIDDKAAERVVHHALEQGINFFDTANTYSYGLSEEYLGRALKGRRSEAVIATKFGLLNWGADKPGFPEGGAVGVPRRVVGNPNSYGASRYYIMNAVDESLRRLQTDHIDLYQLHAPDPNTPVEETLRTLSDLVQMGKVRYIGCSNFKAYQLSQAMESSKALNLEAFVTTQELYNLIDRGIEEELAPCCQAYGIGVITYRPLHMGFLTGKYRRGEDVPASSRYAVKPDYLPKDLLSDHKFDILEKLEEFAGERGHSVGELAIAWLLSHPWVSSAIAGSVKPEQIVANLKAINWKLDPEEVAQLDAITSPGD
ncbi:aldo/keto reductase [Chloroflexota bacterium]